MDHASSQQVKNFPMSSRFGKGMRMLESDTNFTVMAKLCDKPPVTIQGKLSHLDPAEAICVQL